MRTIEAMKVDQMIEGLGCIQAIEMIDFCLANPCTPKARQALVSKRAFLEIQLESWAKIRINEKGNR